MKQTVSIREFRGSLSKRLDNKQAILITNHGEPTAMVYPLKKGSDVPMSVRKDAFRILAEQISKKTKHIDEDEMLKEFEEWRAKRNRSRR